MLDVSTVIMRSVMTAVENEIRLADEKKGLQGHVGSMRCVQSWWQAERRERCSEQAK